MDQLSSDWIAHLTAEHVTPNTIARRAAEIVLASTAIATAVAGAANR